MPVPLRAPGVVPSTLDWDVYTLAHINRGVVCDPARLRTEFLMSILTFVYVDFVRCVRKCGGFFCHYLSYIATSRELKEMHLLLYKLERGDHATICDRHKYQPAKHLPTLFLFKHVR